MNSLKHLQIFFEIILHVSFRFAIIPSSVAKKGVAVDLNKNILNNQTASKQTL